MTTENPIKIWTFQKKKMITEEQEQIAFVQWLDVMKVPYYHIPNGGFRTAREGAKFKRLGTKAGIPDICIARARKGYHGAYIELKRKGGIISDPQRQWLDVLGKEGYYAVVAYGATEAINVTKCYLQ